MSGSWDYPDSIDRATEVLEHLLDELHVAKWTPGEIKILEAARGVAWNRRESLGEAEACDQCAELPIENGIAGRCKKHAHVPA